MLLSEIMQKTEQIKIGKKEYESLLKRVEELEKYRKAEEERFGWLTNNMQRFMEDFFEKKCMTVIVKRDKDMILAEVRKNVMDNMFKENEE